jgi:hypothetical protein
MTDIRKKARVLLNAARGAHVNPDDYLIGQTAVCLAIEQHEAFKQEVSDAVEAYLNPSNRIYSHSLNRFIIPKPKPDPLVAAVHEARYAIRGLLDIAPEENLDSEQAGRAYAALHEIGTALAALGQSK